MKKLTPLLLFCFLPLAAGPPFPISNMDVYDGCGMDGTATSTNLKKLNQQKNRYTAPQANQINHSITLTAMLAPGDDKTRWNSTSGAEITAYVFDIKPGGKETCNCGKTDPVHTDAHIELVLSPTDSASSRQVVVEVTPRFRSIMAESGTDWATTTLQTKFRHKWVKIRGWMMFDAQHANAVENTIPGGGDSTIRGQRLGRFIQLRASRLCRRLKWNFETTGPTSEAALFVAAHPFHKAQVSA